ncbi:MAG: hypothetical protein EPO61_15785 [Nitrospirae bacterium]|nr:MAG: hypothetical protein EPO61_15785 [Nitrospirota bacterium]
MPELAAVHQYKQAARITYPQGKPVEFCPWLRTESLETHVLVSDLIHSLGVPSGSAAIAAARRRKLEQQAGVERVVDQYAADGTLLASHAKRVAPGEIWRLSLGLTPQSGLEYGLLVFRGPYTLNHFQIVGPGTFATCHSRRHPLEESAWRHVRCIPFPLQPGALLSLFLMNRGSGDNRIAISRLTERRRVSTLTADIPRLGCKIVCLNRLLEGTVFDGTAARFLVESTYPYDLYTLSERDGAAAEAFSIQHIK